MKTYKNCGAPTSATPGRKGDFYVDMNTGEVYECDGSITAGNDLGFVTVHARGVNNTSYAWRKLTVDGEGGVSSWNDLTDKPFYEYEEEYTDEVTGETTIEWDGVVGDKETVKSVYGVTSCTYVRVSDAVIPSRIDGVGAVVVLSVPSEGVVQEESVGDTSVYEADSCIVSAGVVVSVPEDNMTCIPPTDQTNTPVTFPKKGLYFIISSGSGAYVSKYTGVLIYNETKTRIVVQKIDEKFLPEPLAYDKSETVTKTELISAEFDGIIGDRVVATGVTMMGMPADYVLLAEGVVTTLEDALAVDGLMFAEDSDIPMTTFFGPVEPVVGENYINMGAGVIVSVFEDNTTVEIVGVNAYAPSGTVTFPKKGIYGMCMVIEGTPFMYIKSFTGNATLVETKTDIKQIDPKFLPDTIAPKELILTSSTEGSSKQFKITVADDGTLAAVEV